MLLTVIHQDIKFLDYFSMYFVKILYYFYISFRRKWGITCSICNEKKGWLE